MTRGTMRGLLQRQLNETTGDEWSAAELNEALNTALALVQKEILKIDPSAFLYIDEATSLAPTITYYPKPIGMWWETEVEIKDAAGAWSTLTVRDYDAARLDPDTASYAHRGRFFRIFPQPTTSVAGGLRITYVPTLVMAVDSDVPDIHLALHLAIVLWAKLIIIGETSEAADPTRASLKETLGDIGFYYRKSASSYCLVPDVDKGY